MNDISYFRFKRQKGIANLVILGIMGLMAVVLPVATKLVQENQENRSQAAGSTCSSFPGDIGNKGCTGSYIQVCQTTNGSTVQWVKSSYCNYGCLNGKCNVCKPYTTQCTSGKIQTCSSGGSWSSPVSCPPGQTCPSGKSICEAISVPPTSTPTPKTCSYGGVTYAIGKAVCQDNNIPAECLSTGSWKTFSTCPYGCSGSGICNPKPVIDCVSQGGSCAYSDDVCKNNWSGTVISGTNCSGSTPTCCKVCIGGSKQCVADGNLYNCVSNRWVAQNPPCAHGCSNNQCNPAPTCIYTAGAWSSCNPTTKTRTRTVTKSPFGCVGGTPLSTSENCTPLPDCGTYGGICKSSCGSDTVLYTPGSSSCLSGFCCKPVPTKIPTPTPKTCSYGGVTYAIGKAVCQDNNIPAECLSTGGWKLFSSCPYGCNGNGVCNSVPPCSSSNCGNCGTLVTCNANTGCVWSYNGNYCEVKKSCTGWTAGTWSNCTNGTQTRTVTATPSGCNSGTSDNKLEASRSCCTTGQKKCTADLSGYVECVNNQWTKDPEICLNKCNSTRNTCNDCTPGTVRCTSDNKSKQTCNNLGTWSALEPCPLDQICSNGTCVAKSVTPECTTGKCEEPGKYYSCTSGKYAETPVSCNTGACKTDGKTCSTQMEEGSPCASSYKTCGANNVAWYCYAGKIKKDDCAAKNQNCSNGTCVAKPAVQVSSLTVSPTTKTITTGQSFIIVPKVLPENATNKYVSWTSSATLIASVDINGKVTAKGLGTAVISGTTKDGSRKTATTTVTVTQVASSTCTSDDTKCIDGGRTLYYCDVTTGTMKEKSCGTNGCDSVKKECKPDLIKICTPNTQYNCDGRNLNVCNSDGSGWVLSKECGIDQTCNATTKTCDSRTITSTPKPKCANENRICVNNLFTCADKYSGKTVEGTDCDSICCIKTISNLPVITTTPTTTKLPTCCGPADGKSFDTLSMLTTTGLCDSKSDAISSGNVSSPNDGWQWKCSPKTGTNKCLADTCEANKTITTTITSSCVDQKGICLPLGECSVGNGSSIGKYDCTGIDVCCQTSSIQTTNTDTTEKVCKSSGGNCISVTEVVNCKINGGEILSVTNECTGKTPVCCQEKNPFPSSSVSLVCSPENQTECTDSANISDYCDPNKKINMYQYSGCNKYQVCREIKVSLDPIVTINMCFNDGVCGSAADSKKSFSLTNPPAQSDILCFAGTPTEVNQVRNLYHWYCLGEGNNSKTDSCFVSITDYLSNRDADEEISIYIENQEISANESKYLLSSSINLHPTLDSNEKEKLLLIIDQFDFNNPDEQAYIIAYVNNFIDKEVEDKTRSEFNNYYYKPNSARSGVTTSRQNANDFFCGIYDCQDPFVATNGIYDPENIIPKVEIILNNSQNKTVEQINQEVIDMFNQSTQAKFEWGDKGMLPNLQILGENYIYDSTIPKGAGGVFRDYYNYVPNPNPNVSIPTTEFCPAGKICLIDRKSQNSLESIVIMLHEYGHYVEDKYIIPEIEVQNAIATEFMSTSYGVTASLLINEYDHATAIKWLKNQLSVNNWVMYGTVAP